MIGRPGEEWAVLQKLVYLQLGLSLRYDFVCHITIEKKYNVFVTGQTLSNKILQRLPSASDSNNVLT